MSLNPQQQAFKEAYLNPESETFGNQTQSALKAGYTQEYAESIGCKDNAWMAEIVGDLERLQLAEKVLEKYLKLEPEDSSWARIQQDTAKFMAETIGKEKYSKRSEVTGKDGNSLLGIEQQLKGLYDKRGEDAGTGGDAVS